MEHSAGIGGRLVIEEAGVDDLEGYAARGDLVIVAAGKGEEVAFPALTTTGSGEIAGVRGRSRRPHGLLGRCVHTGREPGPQPRRRQRPHRRPGGGQRAACARLYLQRILGRGEAPFDEACMVETFEPSWDDAGAAVPEASAETVLPHPHSWPGRCEKTAGIGRRPKRRIIRCSSMTSSGESFRPEVPFSPRAQV